MMSSKPPPMATYSPCRRCVRSTTARTLSDRRGDGDQLRLAHAPCAVSRRCRPPSSQLSSRTGRSDSCASSSGASRSDVCPGRPRRQRRAAGSAPARRRDEQREPAGAAARVVEVPLDLDRAGPCAVTSTQRASGSASVGQRDRAAEVRVGGGDAFERLHDK